MEDMLNMEDQSRFLYTGGEVNINLLPAFSVYLLGVAGFAVLASQLASTDLVSSRAAGPAPAQIPPDNNLPDLQQPQQRLEYYQPQQQYYQPPAAEQQQQYLQPEPRHQQYQQEYYQQQYQYGQNLQPSGVENQVCKKLALIISPQM